MEFFDIGADDISIDLPVDATDMTAEWIAAIEAQMSSGTEMDEADLAELEELLAAADAEEAPEPGPPTVPQVLLAQPELSSFWSLLEASGLHDVFGDPNDPWTVLAPTNDGLAVIGEELAAIRNDPVRLKSFVSRHLIPGAYDLNAMRAAGIVRPLEGANIAVVSQGNSLVLDGNVYVVIGDVPTVSGFVHIIPTSID